MSDFEGRVGLPESNFPTRKRTSCRCKFPAPRRPCLFFDERHLVPPSGFVPVVLLAPVAGLHELADEWLSVLTGKGARAGVDDRGDGRRGGQH